MAPRFLNSDYYSVLLAVVVLIIAGTTIVDAQLIESERVAEFHRRGYTWPLELNHYRPATEGWKALMEHRLRQVAEIDNGHDRYEGYIQTLNAAIIAPNFTEHGFGLARAPDELTEALRKGVRDGVNAPGGPRFEEDIEVIEGNRPWFVDRPDLTQRVLDELQHFPETWAGMELEAHKAYGFRLYRNDSNLHMHIDKSQTHIVSFILHIDSSDDAEPWPILIEDYHGNTHEVILTSGDMLFYESSKVFHGRPRRFKGSWYSSVFVHYYPKYGWKDKDHMLDRHFAVPPSWGEPPKHHFEVPLKMLGTGMKEPSCPNEWCQSEYTIKRGAEPVEHGVWIAPTGEKFEFNPTPQKCEDLHENCEMWASWESNECEINPGYMLKTCKKACKACTVPALQGDEL